MGQLSHGLKALRVLSMLGVFEVRKKERKKKQTELDSIEAFRA